MRIIRSDFFFFFFFHSSDTIYEYDNCKERLCLCENDELNIRFAFTFAFFFAKRRRRRYTHDFVTALGLPVDGCAGFQSSTYVLRKLETLLYEPSPALLSRGNMSSHLEKLTEVPRRAA